METFPDSPTSFPSDLFLLGPVIDLVSVWREKGEEEKRRETGMRMVAMFSSDPVVVPKFVPK